MQEDDEKITFTFNPCGSGQRLWRTAGTRGNAFTVVQKPHSWTFGRTEFPVYCTHCAFMNEILPIKWYGLPIFPAETPEDFDHGPCVWYWYKDPRDIPAMGAVRPAARARRAGCAVTALRGPVCVVGAGTMGGGIATVAALAGHPVLLIDAEPAQAEQAVARIAGELDREVARGRLDRPRRRPPPEGCTRCRASTISPVPCRACSRWRPSSRTWT